MYSNISEISRLESYKTRNLISYGHFSFRVHDEFLANGRQRDLGSVLIDLFDWEWGLANNRKKNGSN